MKRILGKRVRLRLEQLEVRATPAALGGLSVAAGDFNNDGFTDLVIGAGVGQAPRVQLISGYDNQVISEYSAYDNGFTGGVNVAVGDINGDGTDDVITAPATTGGPHVKVFDGATDALLESYFAYAPSFTGGVNLASGDVDADGKDDVITGAGIGGSPHVRVFRQGGQSTIKDFFPFNSTFRGGTYVASADLDQDGAADVVTGAGPGGGPHVRAFSGQSSTELASFFAFDPSFLGGVSVTADHLRDMPAARIITAAASGVPYVKVFSAPGIQEYSGQFVYDNAFRGGVRLATADINGDEIPDLITAPGQGGGPHVRMLDGATGVELAGFFAFQSEDPHGGFSQLRGSTNAPDADGDSLPDAIEKVFFGTTPDNFDSDRDLLPDGVEARTLGLRPAAQDDAAGDYDADGLTNLDEVIFRTRLDQPDTDGDGVFDAGEVSQGSDPLNRADSTAPPPGEMVELNLTVGDPSGSESERYDLVVGNVVHQAPEFGVVSTGLYRFRRGQSYPIQVVHRGSNLDAPDYDYTASISGIGGSSAGFVIDDPTGILGRHDESDFFYAKGKKATLIIPKVATYEVFELRLRTFIPSPALSGSDGAELLEPGQPGLVFGGDNRGPNYGATSFRSSQSLFIDMNPARSKPEFGVDTQWGETTAYQARQVQRVRGAPLWWLAPRPGETPVLRDTLVATHDNNNIRVTRLDSETVEVQFYLEGSNPLEPVSLVVGSISADIRVIVRQRSGEEAFYRVEGEHDGFPAYELYVNGVRGYSYDPVRRLRNPFDVLGPLALLGTRDISVAETWRAVR